MALNLTTHAEDLTSRLSKPNRFNSHFLTPAILEALAILGALGFGYGYVLYLAGGISYYFLLLPAGFFLIASAFNTVLSKSGPRRLVFLAIEMAAPLLFFVGKVAISALFGIFALGFFFAAWGSFKVWKELHANIHISFFRVVHPQFAKSITGLTLMAVLLYLPSWSPKDLFLSEQAFRGKFDALSGVVSKFYPEVRFSPTSTVQSVTEEILRAKFDSTPLLAGSDTVAKETAVREAADSFIKSISQNFNAPISNGESVRSAFYKIIVARIGSLNGRFSDSLTSLGLNPQASLLALWSVVMFLLIRSYATIFSLIIMGVAFVLYHFLLYLNVIHIAGETEVREVLSIS